MTRSDVRKPTLTALALIGAVASVACGTALPPKELKDARAAYEQAQQGPAGKLAPAQLDTARQNLQAAERLFEDEGPDAPETKTQAYIAHRKAMWADQVGRREEEIRRKKRLEKEYDKVERERLNMTQAELAATRDRLEKEKRRASQISQDKELAEKLAAEEIARKEAALAAQQAALEEERKKRETVENKLALAVKSLNELANVKEEARGVVITLSGSVLFSTGKYELLPIAKEKLNEVAKALKDQGYKKIIVEGHTDSRGSETNNQNLSLSRAESVRSHLVSQGIEASKIEAKGLGESRPVATNDTPEGRANNRRVELVVEPE